MPGFFTSVARLFKWGDRLILSRRLKSKQAEMIAGSMFLVIILAGCGEAPRDATRKPAYVADNSLAMATPSLSGQEEADGSESISGKQKIIYSAQIDLVVKDFSPLASQLQELVEHYGGYVADANINSTHGDRRHGRWQVRIPTDNFNTFLKDVANLGLPENQTQTSQDVTEEFVDLQARINNNKRLETRVLELLENRNAELADVIKVEQELARVRGEIERMEGRLRYLTDRTELTTVTVNAREQKDYVAPQAPTFGGQVGDTWSDSVDSLQSTGQATALFFVRITPWLPVILLAVFVSWFASRKLWRRKSTGEL
ncbi:MAG: DUF4349 domain-containing protein [Pirellulales bacterium]|nr:DUF4349 domain-containing protein [Pirellulales bacterium]